MKKVLLGLIIVVSLILIVVHFLPEISSLGSSFSYVLFYDAHFFQMLKLVFIVILVILLVMYWKLYIKKK